MGFIKKKKKNRGGILYWEKSVQINYVWSILLVFDTGCINPRIIGNRDDKKYFKKIGREALETVKEIQGRPTGELVQGLQGKGLGELSYE